MNDLVEAVGYLLQVHRAGHWQDACPSCPTMQSAQHRATRLFPGAHVRLRILAPDGVTWACSYTVSRRRWTQEAA